MEILNARIASFTHEDATAPVLHDVEVRLEAGEILAVTGASGTGKSTLGQVLAGILPAEGGAAEARLRLAGQELVLRPDRRPATDHAAWGRVVAYLPQEPRLYLSGARATVEEELAFGLEYRGVPQDEQRLRVKEVAESLGLSDLLDRDPLTLSGGQERLAAFAALAVTGADVVVLDEPGAGLDSEATERLRRAVTRLAETGTAVVLLAGDFEPLRRTAVRELRLPGAVKEPAPGDVSGTESGSEASGIEAGPVDPLPRGPDGLWAAEPPVLDVRGLSAWPSGLGRRSKRSGPPAFSDLDLAVEAGECVAVTGSNGTGKTTLLRAVVGLTRSVGFRRSRGREIPSGPVRAAAGIAVMFQNPSDQLTETSLLREIRAVLPRASESWILQVLAEVGLEGEASTHPYDLSAAQRRLLCLAQTLVRETPLALLDEPGVGLDASGRRVLVRSLRRVQGQGRGVLMTTHDRALIRELGAKEVRMSEAARAVGD